MLKEDIPGKVRAKQPIVEKFLKEEILPLDSRLEIRGIGLLWGIDFNNIPGEPLAGKVVHECFARGLIAECAGRRNNVLKLMPPLVIEEDQLRAGLAILKEAVIAVLNA